MDINFAVIGGDLRTIELIKIISKNSNYKLKTYGLKLNKDFKEKNITICNNLQDALYNSDIVIGPVPFSKDGENIYSIDEKNEIKINDLIYSLENNKIFIAGNLSDNIIQLINNKNNNIIVEDIMKKDRFAIMNLASTVEGAIKSAISNTDKVLQGSRVLILGFGRIGKLLAKKFKLLDTYVTCTARKEKDLAWIDVLGYSSINIKDSLDYLNKQLPKFDIIVNTVPKLLLTKENLKYVNKECLLIELASKPGGIDSNECSKLGLNFVNEQGLPGRIAPFTSARIIYNEIKDIVRKNI